MNATFTYEDIRGPVLIIDYIAIAINVFGMLCLMAMAISKTRALLSKKTRNFVNQGGLAVILTAFVAQIFLLLGSYVMPTYLVYFLTNLTTVVTDIVYTCFQTVIFDRLREKNLNSKDTFLRYAFLVIACFYIGLETPQVLRYAVFTPTDGSFWNAWDKYAYVGPLVVSFVEFIFNLWILRKVFALSNSTKSSYNSEAFRMQLKMSFLCLFQFAIDMGAIVLFLFIDEVIDETTTRLSNAKIVIANAEYSFHVVAGLSYLSIVLNLKKKMDLNLKERRNVQTRQSEVVTARTSISFD